MQNRDKSFVNHLLSLSMLLPAAAVSVSTLEPAASTADEARPVAQAEAPTAAVAAKLSDLAGAAQEQAWIQWTDVWAAGAAERDDAAHLSSADLLRSIKAEQA